MLGQLSNMITFKELGLQENILTAIDAMGFVTPSPIQEKAIPQISKKQKHFSGKNEQKLSFLQLSLTHSQNQNYTKINHDKTVHDIRNAGQKANVLIDKAYSGLYFIASSNAFVASSYF